MIKDLTCARNFKLMLPLSFNMPTVYPSCIAHMVLSLGCRTISNQKQVLKNQLLDGCLPKLYYFWILVKFTKCSLSYYYYFPRSYSFILDKPAQIFKIQTN